MANTFYLRQVVEKYVCEQLEQEFGQPFGSVVLPLTPGGAHEFDAVSADRKVVASVKSASGLTATGRNPSGKIKDSIAELYFLTLVEAEKRQLVLTTPAFFEIFKKAMKGKVSPNVEVRCIPLPGHIQQEVDLIVAAASQEVSPVTVARTVATEIETLADEADSPPSDQLKY